MPVDRGRGGRQNSRIVLTSSKSARFGEALFAAVLALSLVLLMLAASLCASDTPSKSKPSERPKLPYNMMGLGPDELDAYDSKAEPVANANAALTMLDTKGWQLIQRYFSNLGVSSPGAENLAHPGDATDNRVFANFLAEDATLNPMPLLCAIWSLPDSDLSGKLKQLHDQLKSDMTLEDYSQSGLDALRKGVNDLTEPAKTAKGAKYRQPKNKLTFTQALQLYAMTVALIRIETKWADKADSPPPDMLDFSNRLSQQMPKEIADGATVGFFLYRPGVLNQPLSKGEFEERADVVIIKRAGMTFEAEQFPVYLTADEKEWNPAWILPQDDLVDGTLIARKYEREWTRLDGPYLWFRFDQLDAPVVYQATARFSSDNVTIEAEREIQNRGLLKRVDRPRNYDPLRMTAFVPATDTVAQPFDPLTVDFMSLDEQVRGLKSMRYFSSSFRAWCAYGISQSGTTPDGRGWITVMRDLPRADASGGSSPRSESSTANSAARQ